MRYKASENTHSPLPDFEVLVLHAVEKHKKIFVARNKRIELGVQMLQHSHSNSVLVISGRGNEEAMKKFIDYSLDI